MIDTPTVLILGAGASSHVKYPLGSQLISNLCKKPGTGAEGEFPLDWTLRDAEKFVTRLSRSGYYSIDAFLETVRDQADIGKFLIARELKRHEQMSELFPPADSGWYQYLFNRLLERNNPVGFEKSNLGIVTFNYDRSLEVYLHEALTARFGMESKEASSVLSQIPIVHVHGSLGPYPKVPYVSSCETSELYEISKQIQIIHEVEDRNDGFCNNEFEKANSLLSEAEQIIFLGFGFHPDNVRRFRFFSPDNIQDKHIYATTYRMGKIEHADLVSRLEPLGFKTNHFNGWSCNEFFAHVKALD